jgi:hypothetical protein
LGNGFSGILSGFMFTMMQIRERRRSRVHDLKRYD